MLGWTALDLAAQSKVGVATIRRVEVVDGEIPVTLANEAAIRQSFEAAGIEFIEENGTGEGIRFRNRYAQRESNRQPVIPNRSRESTSSKRELSSRVARRLGLRM